VWKTDRPFDNAHYPWEPPIPTSTAAASDFATTVEFTTNIRTDMADELASLIQSGATTACSPSPESTVVHEPVPSGNPSSETPALEPEANKTAAGHKRDKPAKKVVSTADSSVDDARPAVKQPGRSRNRVDYAFVREQITMHEILSHLNLLSGLRGSGRQRRGRCPIHGDLTSTGETFSVHLGKNAFQCFHADCSAQGNVLDFWAALHHLSLHEAAVDLAKTFGLAMSREEEPVSSPHAAKGQD
jgi:hypothetical protein